VLRGVDVSQYQGTVDWSAVAASGVSFAFVKVAEGDGYVDPLAAKNLAGARTAGLVVGAYNVAHPSQASDPAAQARAHYGAALAAGGGLAGDLPHVIDFELSGRLSPADLAAWFSAHEAELGRLLGTTPLAYTFPSFWAPLAGLVRSAGALWWASYSGRTDAPAAFAPVHKVPVPWQRARFWQWTDHGKLPNGAQVDADLFDGSLDDLRALTLADVEAIHPLFVPPDSVQ
jgi:lysozyme